MRDDARYRNLLRAPDVLASGKPSRDLVLLTATDTLDLTRTHVAAALPISDEVTYHIVVDFATFGHAVPEEYKLALLLTVGERIKIRRNAPTKAPRWYGEPSAGIKNTAATIATTVDQVSNSRDNASNPDGV